MTPASPVRQAQQVRWAQSAQQVPKGRGGPRGLLEIPHKGEVASIGSLVDVLESQPIGQRRAMTFCWLQAPAVLTPSGSTLLRLRKAARGRAIKKRRDRPDLTFICIAGGLALSRACPLMGRLGRFGVRASYRISDGSAHAGCPATI